MDTRPARPNVKTSSPVLLTVVWLAVALPALWGVSQTVLKSLDLFRSPPAAATTTAATTHTATGP